MSCKSTATIGKGEACIKSSSEENALHKTFVVAPIISPESQFFTFFPNHTDHFRAPLKQTSKDIKC